MADGSVVSGSSVMGFLLLDWRVYVFWPVVAFLLLYLRLDLACTN